MPNMQPLPYRAILDKSRWIVLGPDDRREREKVINANKEVRPNAVNFENIYRYVVINPTISKNHNCYIIYEKDGVSDSTIDRYSRDFLDMGVTENGKLIIYALKPIDGSIIYYLTYDPLNKKK